MEYGQQQFIRRQPCYEEGGDVEPITCKSNTFVIPRLMEEPRRCTVKVVPRSEITQNVIDKICRQNPEMFTTGSYIPQMETGCTSSINCRCYPVTENTQMWQLPIPLENVNQPEEIQIKVDPIFRTIKISTGNKTMKRLLPLPENIDINELKSVFTKEGILLLKAPFLQEEEIQGRRFTTVPCVNADEKFVTLPGWTRKCDQEEDEDEEKVEEYKKTLPLHQYLHLLKTLTLLHGKKNLVECVKDVTTGEWKIHIHLDTLGYQPENFQVLFHGKQRRLAVVGKHQVTGFGQNLLHREFHVPEYLNVNQMQWRVLNNGLMRIELPFVRSWKGKMPMEGKFVQNIPCTFY